MKRSLLLTVVFMTAISLFVVSGCKKGGSSKGKTEPEAHVKEMVRKSFEESKKAVAVKVNGEPITMYTLLQEMNAIGPRYLAGGAQRTPELDQKVRNDALRNIIFQTLGVQEAKKRGLQVKPETVNEHIAMMKKGFGSEDAFRKYLETNSMSEEELRKSAERDALFEMVATQEVDAKTAPVTEAALRQRYNKEKASLKDSNHKQMSFESARMMLEQKLKMEAAEKRMRAWEQELKKNATIEIVDKSLQTASAAPQQK